MQTNFGGVLSIAGAPVGRELGKYYLRGRVESGSHPQEDGARGQIQAQALSEGGQDFGDGSVMIVVATDAPLGNRNLTRLARRALAGLARTGSSMTNGSGDFVISFSTTPVSRLAAAGPVSNNRMSPLFHAAIEATEEAIYNSLFMATRVVGHRGTAEALPIDSTMAILKQYGVVRP